MRYADAVSDCEYVNHVDAIDAVEGKYEKTDTGKAFPLGPRGLPMPDDLGQVPRWIEGHYPGVTL